jgi:putative DNA primase/helicase
MSKQKVQLVYGPWDKKRPQLTDFGNAERLISKYGDILRYSYERRNWLVWKGTHWQWDMVGDIEKYAKLTVRGIYTEAQEEENDEIRKSIIAHAQKSESGARISAMINLAQSEKGIPVLSAALDSDPWKFNVFNGTINIKTGELQKHRPEDLITVMVPINYDPEATCPIWLNFLNKVMNGDEGLIQYLQAVVGYSLTGDISQQILFFLYGLGSNGKSTFITTIRKLMGNYGERTNTELFLTKEKGAGGPREGLANLKGKRFVAASEIEDGKRLAVSLIKDLTGGESIKADRKYEHEIEYTPTYKIWLTGNHKPGITDSTLSTWRRMKLIPFTVTISSKEADPLLSQKL